VAAVAAVAPKQDNPRTLVGACGVEYKALLPYVNSGSDIPVEMLLRAIETQATHSQQLGTFMNLIVKIDKGNMKNMREAWEKYGKPSGLRELLKAEVAAGVQQPTRLVEGSAVLSLLWSMRMKRFTTVTYEGFADTESAEPTSAFGLRAYESHVGPYHGFILQNTFRTGLRVLPSRETMLNCMEAEPPVGLEGSVDAAEAAAAEPRRFLYAEGPPELTKEERRAICLTELVECSEATTKVHLYVQKMIDDFDLKDDRKL